MRQLVLVLRFVVVALFFAGGPALAQDAETPANPDWQSVITGQIEAFRRGDAEAALGFAGAAFQLQYRDADRFYADIKQSGYAPIVESRTHSFGDFRLVDDTGVLQIVRLQGPDLGLYQALYRLAVEPDGWRVQGVLLKKQPGLGV